MQLELESTLENCILPFPILSFSVLLDESNRNLKIFTPVPNALKGLTAMGFFGN